MVKQTVVHPYHGILLNNTKKITVDTTWMNLKVKIKTTNPKGYILHDFIYIILSNGKVEETTQLLVSRD